MATETDHEETEPEGPLSAFDLPAAPRVPLDTRDIPVHDIQLLRNLRPQHHGIEGLAETMHTEGQLQACVVREAPPGAEHDKPFELIFGYRRHLAAQSLGWDTIRCEVRDVPNENMRRQLIIENFQRENLSPVAEARAMYDLKYSEDPPLSNAEIARQLGCDPSQVSNRLGMIIKLAPPRPADAPPLAHELAAKHEARPAIEEDEDDEMPELDNESSEPSTGDETHSSEDEMSASVPEEEPEEVHAASSPGGGLALPGDDLPAETGDNEEKPPLDILALVDNGTISASTAEVIASLDTRTDQEQLTKLVIRHGWSVKKAAAWAREAKRDDLEQASEDEALGPVEMLRMEDVVPLQKLRLRSDIEPSTIERIILYMQLRNGMDQEMLDYISERLGYSYETLWDYVSLLEDDQVLELKRRMAVRYVTAAHRFFSLEPTLKDSLGVPEDTDDEEGLAAAEADLALPGLDDDALGGIDEILALGPDTAEDEEDEDHEPEEDEDE